jgi:hypothetical protein
MRMLIVQVLSVLLMGYRVAATPTNASTVNGNNDEFVPGSSAVGKVSVKHVTTAVTAISRDQM